jgi:uncharacterized protein
VKLLAPLLCVLLLGACAHSPDPTYFALSSQHGRALPSRPLKVELRRAGLPGYLDRPHIVHRATAERLELEGDERWGASLDEMLGATLAENLSQRLPGCVVYTESGAISSPPDARVEIQVFRFERTAQGVVELLAEVAVHQSASQPPTLRRFALSQKPSSSRTSDVVSSMSQLLGKLSDGIAPLIAQNPQEPIASPELPPP